MTQIVAENSTDLKKRTKILSSLNAYWLRKSHRFWIRQNNYYVDIKWNIYHEYCFFLIYGQKLTFWMFQHLFVLAYFFLLSTDFFVLSKQVSCLQTLLYFDNMISIYSPIRGGGRSNPPTTPPLSNWCYMPLHKKFSLIETNNFPIFLYLLINLFYTL